MKKFSSLQEDLRNWFNPNHPKGGWKRVNTKGEVVGDCAREPGEPKPKCMSNAQRASLSKKEKASAVKRKRKEDPNAERQGDPINVKSKVNENMEQLDEKNKPTNPELWSRAIAQAKSKFDVYPSAYANGWASKWYKEHGGGWKTVSEAKEKTEYDYEGDMARGQLQSIISNAQRVHDMLEDDTNIAEWVQSKITLAEDYISTVANYMMSEVDESVDLDEAASAAVRMQRALDKIKQNREASERRAKELLNPKQPVQKEEVELQEGRPSQRHPLEGHDYHKKTDAELVHIAKDAHAAAEAMKSHNTTAENKYRDQANDSATVRHFRKTSGMPDWYKKKYGHMKEEMECNQSKAGVKCTVHGMKDCTPGEVKEAFKPMDEPNYNNSIEARQKKADENKNTSTVKNIAKQAMKKQVTKMSVKESLEESRKAEIVKDILKKGKKSNDSKFESEPVLGTTVVKADN